MAVSSVSKIRARKLAEAKRSLKLTADAIAQHDQILKEGGVPEQDFSASVTKYLRALDALRLCDAIAGGTAEEPDGQVLVDAADLAQVLDAFRVTFPVAPGTPETPLDRLGRGLAGSRAAFTPPGSSGQPENQEGTP